MPLIESTSQSDGDKAGPLRQLPFPPLKKSHVLHCSCHSWYPKFRSISPKARLIPLSTPFVEYLRADGIILPPEGPPQYPQVEAADDDSGIFSGASDSEDENVDPSAEWREIHVQIHNTIKELGGKVTPKLNWSAPKDATWISATNDMECRSPNEVYLLLKSSDFITHDLEKALDGCVEDPPSNMGLEQSSDPTTSSTSPEEVPYHLILRKSFNLNPSLEFRCFVRSNKLIALCQRDLNHFDFLFSMREDLTVKIKDFFEQEIRPKYPDNNFVFDVYVPPPHNRVWLIDINPWDVRTDPLLFSWLEILQMPDLEAEEKLEEEEVEDVTPERLLPELRLVGRDDPEAYQFNTPRYSAHKLPKDVVDAAGDGPGGMREMMEQWQKILAKQVEEDEASDGDEALQATAS